MDCANYRELHLTNNNHVRQQREGEERISWIVFHLYFPALMNSSRRHSLHLLFKLRLIYCGVMKNIAHPLPLDFHLSVGLLKGKESFSLLSSYFFFSPLWPRRSVHHILIIHSVRLTCSILLSLSLSSV